MLAKNGDTFSILMAAVPPAAASAVGEDVHQEAEAPSAQQQQGLLPGADTEDLESRSIRHMELVTAFHCCRPKDVGESSVCSTLPASKATIRRHKC